MPVKPLPSNANLNHLKHQAKDLLQAHQQHHAQVAQRLREFHPRFARTSDAEIFACQLKLSDAQLAIARERGFANWAALKGHLESRESDNLHRLHHERITDPIFRQAVHLLDQGDGAALRRHLQEHPTVVDQHVAFPGGNYFRNPTLLEFCAENPIRHGTLPQNIVEVATAILEAGAKRNASAITETLGLVCSGRIVRECQAQIPLIDLLCDYGADPQSAMSPALVHAEFEAVQALIRRGAQLDFPAAAALGRLEDARRLLPNANPERRHRALALAAQFGHTSIVQLLLDVGEDPNRYNPVGCHSHSTPLHQAALAGHYEIVRLLVEHGASLDAQDTVWQGTPAGWAKHANNQQMEDYLVALKNATLETAKPSPLG